MSQRTLSLAYDLSFSMAFSALSPVMPGPREQRLGCDRAQRSWAMKERLGWT